MESSEQLRRMQAVRELVKIPGEGSLSEALKGGRVDPIKNKREHIEGLMQVAGLADPRVKEFLDQLEK